MSLSQTNDRDLELKSLFRSDTLREVRELLLKMPVFRPLLQTLLQIRVIVDANIIQGELRWRLAKRLKPENRSGLHEAVASGVIVAFAPVFLRVEIEEHIEDIALETGKSVTEAEKEWREFQTHLHFYQPADPIKVVVGAHNIRGELRWRLSRGRKPDDRSGLHEAIASGVSLHAPISLMDEIEKHIAEVAKETGTTVARVMEEWRELQTHIHFYQPASADNLDPGITDVDDLPYKRAYQELAAAAVYSRDTTYSK